MTTIKLDPGSVEMTDSDRADVAALQLALDLMLADPGRVDQVTRMLAESSPWEVARFCSYCQQATRLALRPWMTPPCHIHTRENAEAILEKGGVLEKGSNCGPAHLVLDMIDAGVSRWHPDPFAALAEAKRGGHRER